jgi:novobiocin biosynthesis protein NovU/D-mycarose 3-C-methyltransferase
MYKQHTVCRACGCTELKPACDLGVQSLANDFVKPGEELAGYAPLKVLFCPECTLAQLSVVVDPKILYSNYPYVTSRSRTMQDHFQLLWQAINVECKPESVLEIGSNDGWFLKFCRDNGAQSVLGIDPAANLRPGEDSGIICLCGMFDCVTAGIAKGSMPSPDVIVARHVFAHIDDWNGFIKNLDVLASRETLIVIEAPYVMDLLKNVEFDTIYHEHLSYISIKAMAKLLEHTPFHLHKVLRFQIHGGAIVMMLRRSDSNRPVDISVLEYVFQENITLSPWRFFETEMCNRITAMKRMVGELVYASGKTVCGLGASAKSTVWINSCGFTKEDIACIYDNTPQKHGTLSPGSGIPILPEDSLASGACDYAVMFCWNFRSEVMASHQEFLVRGGKFIVPVPKLEIVD